MIIVTGGAGFVGSNLVRGLNRRGIDDAKAGRGEAPAEGKPGKPEEGTPFFDDHTGNGPGGTAAAAGPDHFEEGGGALTFSHGHP